MDEQPFENGLINLDEYEIVPDETPPDETPRQYLLRMTGRDFHDLAFDGRDYTWKEVRDMGALPIIGRIMEIAYMPRITLRKRNE